MTAGRAGAGNGRLGAARAAPLLSWRRRGADLHACPHAINPPVGEVTCGLVDRDRGRNRHRGRRRHDRRVVGDRAAKEQAAKAGAHGPRRNHSRHEGVGGRRQAHQGPEARSRSQDFLQLDISPSREAPPLDARASAGHGRCAGLRARTNVDWRDLMPARGRAAPLQARGYRVNERLMQV